MNKHQLAFFAAAVLLAPPAMAQPAGTSKPGEIRSDIRLEAYHFNNFFQATTPGSAQNINALGLEYRIAKRFTADDELFAHVGARTWSNNNISNSYNARVGWNHPGAVQAWRVYIDERTNSPSFNVGAAGASYGVADTTTLAGEYSYRLRKIWQLGADASYARQTFPNSARNNNDTVLGASLRYRGFGWHFTPAVGMMTGRLNVNTPTEDYKQSGWWVQAEVIPYPWLYFSARYYPQSRDYSTPLVTHYNFGREEDRPQLSLIASIKSSSHLTWLIYYAQEHTASSRPNSNFNDSMLLVGPQYRF